MTCIRPCKIINTSSRLTYYFFLFTKYFFQDVSLSRRKKCLVFHISIKLFFSPTFRGKYLAGLHEELSLAKNTFSDHFFIRQESLTCRIARNAKRGGKRTRSRWSKMRPDAQLTTFLFLIHSFSFFFSIFFRGRVFCFCFLLQLSLPYSFCFVCRLICCTTFQEISIAKENGP